MQEIKEVFRSLNYQCSELEYQDAIKFFSEDRSTVRNLIEELNWNKPLEEQNNAINQLANNLLPCEYIFLVFPDKYTVVDDQKQIIYCRQSTDKARWENAAKTIVQIGWPKTDKIIVPLFMWLLDPNWPGSKLIYSFISSLPKNILSQKVDEILKSPDNYALRDYEELKDILEEFM